MSGSSVEARMFQIATPLDNRTGGDLPRLVLYKADGTPYSGLTSSNVAAHQAASVAADVPTLKTDFNALLTKLQAAGLMA